MTESEVRLIALKRAGYALSQIANNQMNTWTKYPSSETPRDIVAKQIMEAMNDALDAKS